MRQIKKDRGYAMIYLDSLQELEKEDINADIVILKDKDEHGIYQPEKIFWKKVITSLEFGETLKSKKRKQLNKTKQQVLALGIRLKWEEDLTQNSYLKFLEKYQKVISGMQHGNLFLNENWYTEKIIDQKKKYSGIFFYQEEKFLGGAIVAFADKGFYVGYVAHDKFSYKELNLGLSPLIIDEVYRQAVERKLSFISYGRDRNLYGVMNSFELLRFKKTYGFSVFLPEEGLIKQTVFFPKKLSEINFIGCFLLLDNDKIGLHIFTDEEVEASSYCPENILSTEKSSLVELFLKHKNYLENFIK